MTREKILSEAASLFNTQGFKATSLSDITKATGLTKGAIYRHFGDKEGLEAYTFDFMAGKMQSQLASAIQLKDNAPDKLLAICEYFQSYLQFPALKGGCPILNAGVEMDDTRPKLNQQVVSLLDKLQQTLENIISKGIKYGQIKTGTEPVAFSTLFIAALEGGVLLSKVRNRDRDLEMVIAFLHTQIECIKV
ncbi:MAG: TetR/AcrR family transcriptional regulator [Cyclobacteriaceae bacterium]